MKKLSLLLLTVVLALTLSACRRVKSNDYYGTYAGHYETLNYLVTQSASDSDLYANFVDALVENDNYGNIQESLATDWKYETTSDGKQVWTFKIRKNVKWVDSDGEEYAKVTAHDWVTAASYILEPNNSSELYYLMTMFIDGSEEFYDARVARVDAQADITEADEVLASTSATAEEKADAQASKTAAQKVLADTPEPDFSTVGVEAVDDYTLKYTLKKPAPYFLTVLTYSAFFPVNKDFIEDMGTDFGKNGDCILYNGAYILTEDEVDVRVAFEKNENYWDKKHVYINKIILVFIPGDMGPDWARIRYENKELSGFRITENDIQGWEKYVTGSDKSGTMENPYNPDAYIAQTVSQFTYYSLWNFARVNFEGSTKTEAQKTNTQKALLNTSFRQGFFYGMDKDKFLQYYTPSAHDQYARNTFMPRELAVDEDGKDYIDYLAEVYASKNGVSVQVASERLTDGIDSKHDKAKALAAFAKAKTELTAQGVTFPVVVETIASNNPNQAPYFRAIAQQLNEDFGQYIEFRLNTPQTTSEWTLWSNTKKSYDIRWYMGWGPDYADPLTYANTYVIGGDMINYSNLNSSNMALQEQLLGEYTRLVKEADAITDLKKTAQRYAKFAEAEYKLTYEDAIVIPFFAQTGNNVYISRTKPYTAMKAPYGLSASKYKYLVVLEEPLTREERNELKAEYEKNRK